MAKQRIVSTKFWSDPYVRKLDTDGKTLFIYLLTNDKTTIAGVYEISVDDMLLETKIKRPKIVKLLRKFQQKEGWAKSEKERENNGLARTFNENARTFNGLARIQYRDGWLLICNFLEYQNLNPKVMKGIENAMQRAPEWARAYVIDRLSHLNLNFNLNLNSLSERAPAVAARPPEDKRKDHPAIAAVRTAASRFPPKTLWDRIIREVGEKPDAKFIEACFETWLSVGGRPQNYEKWLFEPHKTGLPPEVFGKDVKNGSKKTVNSNGREGHSEQSAAKVTARIRADPL